MIQDEEKLYQEIESLEKRWTERNDELNKLIRQRELETRTEEQLRQDAIIADRKKNLGEIERLLSERRPEDYLAFQERVLVSRAYKYKQNGVYDKALDQWKQIAVLFPANVEAPDSIRILNELLGQKDTARDLIKQVMRRLKEIKPIYMDVVQRLKNLSESSDDQMLLDQVQLFVDGELDGQDFMDVWKMFADDNPLQQHSQTRIDYNRLAGRIKRGEIIIFLGSGVHQAYDADAPDEAMLAEYLAENIRLQNHNGSLPSVAEYYDYRSDYGRPSLLSKLQEKLPNNGETIGLYHSLAAIDRPLILISSAYDNLLEKTFQQHRKRFVEILSVTNPHSGYPLGDVILRYSDRENPPNAPTYSKDGLSQLNLLESGYSLIYKIRGTCDSEDCVPHDTQFASQDALTLMESDYFNFARYSDRIIPGYVAKQFRTREFLFIGFRPRFWEDRLLVNAILEKRSNVKRECMLIGDSRDEFEAAFWDNRQVRRYDISIHQLDEHLRVNAEEEVAA